MKNLFSRNWLNSGMTLVGIVVAVMGSSIPSHAKVGGGVDGGGGAELTAKFIVASQEVIERIRPTRPDLSLRFRELLKTLEIRAVTQLVYPPTGEPIDDSQYYAWGQPENPATGARPLIQLVCKPLNCFWQNAFETMSRVSIHHHVAHELLRSLGDPALDDDNYQISILELRLNTLWPQSRPLPGPVEPQTLYSQAELLQELLARKYRPFNELSGDENMWGTESFHSFTVNDGTLYLTMTSRGEPTPAQYQLNPCGSTSQVSAGATLSCTDGFGERYELKILKPEGMHASISVRWPNYTFAIPYFPGFELPRVGREWRERNAVEIGKPQHPWYDELLKTFSAARLADVGEIGDTFMRRGACIDRDRAELPLSGTLLTVLQGKPVALFHNSNYEELAQILETYPSADYAEFEFELNAMKTAVVGLVLIGEPLGGIADPAIVFGQDGGERREIRITSEGYLVMAVTTKRDKRPLSICQYF